MKVNAKILLVVCVGLASQAALASDLVIYCGKGRKAHDRDKAQVCLGWESNGDFRALRLKGEEQEITSAKFLGGAYRLVSGGVNYVFSGECGDGESDTARVTITPFEGPSKSLPCQCDED